MVPIDSANPGVGDFVVLDLNHFELIKPKSKQDINYQLLVKFLSSEIARTATNQNNSTFHE